MEKVNGMKIMNLRAVAKKKFKVTTDSNHTYAVFDNILDRDFSTTGIMKKQLVCDALMMALFKRKFPKRVIVYSDRGSQYCSNSYKKLLKITVS